MQQHGVGSSGSGEEGLIVIHVGLFRMATRSFTEAYRILGYKTHHGTEDVLGNPWVSIEQAAEATWPNVPDARPRSKFTRSDWDNLWGREYDIVTDLASPFVVQLIEAYPDAKVVVVQRDFDSWWHSYQTGVLDKIFSPSAQIFVVLIRYVLRSRAADAMMKLNYGLFNATNMAEIRAHARQTYDEYYRTIRTLVPPHRRLEYTIGDAWQPLCEFLGKEVPSKPFPRLNDGAARKESQRQGELMVLLRSARKMSSLVVGICAIAVWFWFNS